MMIFITQILIVVVFLLGMLVLSKGVIELKNDSFQLFENLNKQLVKKKEDNCREFIDRYTEFEED